MRTDQALYKELRELTHIIDASQEALRLETRRIVYQQLIDTLEAKLQQELAKREHRAHSKRYIKPHRVRKYTARRPGPLPAKISPLKHIPITQSRRVYVPTTGSIAYSLLYTVWK